jgi:predicted DNA-binding WGR domain protein
MKKYFEYIDAESNEFWEIEVSGNTRTVRYGKIDTDGQTEAKDFDSADDAREDAVKLISSKKKTGYSEKPAVKSSQSEESEVICSAKDWAKDYMQRFEKMVTELENHDLIQNVRFNKGKPLSDEKFNRVHEKIGYRLNDYIVEFYKLNNGLQLHWNSFATKPEVDSSKHRQAINSINDYRNGDNASDAAEGWVCIYPFDTLISHYGPDLMYDAKEVNHLNFYKDSDAASVKIFDDFNSRFQTGIPVNGDPNPYLYFFSDYGSSISDSDTRNFVIYMEYLLLMYGCTSSRTYGLQGVGNDASLVDPVELPEFLTKAIQKYSTDDYIVDNGVKGHTINTIIKVHYTEHNLDDIGGLWSLAKDLGQKLQERMFGVLDLSSDDIEGLKNEYESFIEDTNKEEACEEIDSEDELQSDFETNPLKAFYEFNGKGVKYQDIPNEVIEKYSKMLPEFLIKIWQDEGLSSFNDGFVWFVNPDEYSGILSLFVPESENLHVIMRTAFGGLFFMKEHENEHPELVRKYSYFCPIYRKGIEMSDQLEDTLNGWLTTEELLAPYMFSNLYSWARKRLPIPAYDECYGFVPAIAMGGDMEPDNIQIVKQKEHLSFLAQI